MNEGARCALLLALAAASAAALAGEPEAIAGFVDGRAFIEAVGDDAVTVEISLAGPLLAALTKMDPELQALAGGLQSIHAVVLESPPGSARARLRTLVAETDAKLLKQGWERLARVREPEGEVKILVLPAGDVIRGLVVMVVNEEQVVFANIAGVLDLAKIAAIGEGLDLPGLDEIDPD
jgi:hypothetical protein